MPKQKTEPKKKGNKVKKSKSEGKAPICPKKIKRIMKRLKKHKPLLQVLATSNPTVRDAILSTANNPFIQTLSECSLNVLNGNQKISERCKKELKRYKSELRDLAARSSEVSFLEKRDILQQEGGSFLPTLIQTVLSGLLDLI